MRPAHVVRHCASGYIASLSERTTSHRSRTRLWAYGEGMASSKRIRFGRAPDNDVVIDKPSVDPYHAAVWWDGRSLILQDLDTTSGTFINGQRVRALPVRQGDIITLGTHAFKLAAEHLGGLDTSQHAIPTASNPQIASPAQSKPPKRTMLQDAPGVMTGGEVSVNIPSQQGPNLQKSAQGAKRTMLQSADDIKAQLPQAPSSSGGVKRTVFQTTDDIKAALPGQSAPAAPAGGAKRTVLQSVDDLDLAAGSATGGFGAVALPPGAVSISIGYAADNDVVIPVPQVAAHHCRLWKGAGQYIIDDVGSSAGTFVNGQKIERATVSTSDRIELGSYRLVLSAALLEKFDHKRPGQDAASAALVPSGDKTVFSIGRDPDENDIVLDAAMVSGRHCELRYNGDGWRVVDLGSTNGTYVNTRNNRISEARVMPSDVLFFGTYRFPVSRLKDFLTDSAGHKLGDLTIPDKPVIIVGRADECDLTIDASQVSRRHAKLTRKSDGLYIEDLGSANGTFINGVKIKKPTLIGPNDVIGLGSHTLRFDPESGTLDSSYQGDIMLQARDITIKVDRGRKTILHNVSFTVYPTEFVGLMGPSGAGKTTLMMALNGYLPPSSGQSLINGTDLYSNYDAFRGNIGYVPQDDIIHSELTVWEALYYTARLRLPPDTTHKEITRIIGDILERLEISQTRDVLIGSPARKGISGGQRKRVNLAQELITQPSLLFLDEPTSGLASEDTINVMKLLRTLADDGRTILLTIHQPSLEAYRTMDNIVYLADGHLVYYGPTYPESITYFNPDIEQGTPEGDLVLSDPGNALKPLAEAKRQGEDMSVRAQRYLSSGLHKEYVERRQESGTSQVAISSGSKKKTARRFGLGQWWVLTRRYLTIKRKDLANTLILFIQAPIIAAIIVGVFWGRTGANLQDNDEILNRIEYVPVAFFLLSISAIWFGCSNSAREIVAEQAIYRRERMVNLKIPSYVMSKFTVLGLVCALQCAVLLGVTDLFLGFHGSFMWLYFFLVLCSLAGVGMGLVLSAMVRTNEAAIALVPLLLIPQVILGGLIVPIEDMKKPMQVATYPMLARWGFEGLLHAENEAATFLKPIKKELIEQEAMQKGRFGELQSPLEKYFHEEDVYLVQYKGSIEMAKKDTKAFDKGQRLYGKYAAIDIGVLLAFNLLMLLGVVAIMKVKDPEVG